MPLETLARGQALKATKRGLLRMYNLLLALCHWLQNTPLVLWLYGSNWAYPPVQATHFTGLSLWIGTNVALDLRLLGLGKGRQTIAELSDALFILNWAGFAIAILGGFLLFSVSATGYVANPAFRIKLGILLPVALLLHIVNQRQARVWSQAAETPVLAKVAGLAELLLWLSVAIAAVSIPFV
jgi:hypothetical protein